MSRLRNVTQQPKDPWRTSAKLRAVTELLRRRGIPQAGVRGGLPTAWRDDLTAEIMLALRLSRPGADKLITLGWSLATRLPRTAEALDQGMISEFQARIVQDATAALTDDAAVTADAYLAGQLDGKTPGETRKLAEHAAVYADPDAAQARREAPRNTRHGSAPGASRTGRWPWPGSGSPPRLR